MTGNPGFDVGAFFIIGVPVAALVISPFVGRFLSLGDHLLDDELLDRDDILAGPQPSAWSWTDIRDTFDDIDRLPEVRA